MTDHTNQIVMPPRTRNAAEIIDTALSQPEETLDYAELKLAFDALIASFDAAAARAELVFELSLRRATPPALRCSYRSRRAPPSREGSPSRPASTE